MKYKVQLQTLDMETIGKEVVVELNDDERPTPYNIISQRLTNYFIEHKDELGFKNNIELARAVFDATNDTIDNLIYYVVKKVVEEI